MQLFPEKISAMHRFVLVFLLVVGSVGAAFSQDAEFIELLKKGIELHDGGAYLEAIEHYEAAQKINTENLDVAYYEIALSYQAMGDYEKAIKAAEKAMDYNGANYVPAAMVKATSLDYQGKGKKSIRYFEQVIEAYPDEQMLYFNAGVTAFRHEMLEKGMQFLERSVELNPAHPSSHYYLGRGAELLEKRPHALLAYYFYLLLEEGNEERRMGAIKAVQDLLTQNIEKTSEQSTTISLSSEKLDALNAQNPFQRLDFMLQLKMAAVIGAGLYTNGQEFLQQSTTAFFEILPESDEPENALPGFWQTTYVELYRYILENEASNTFACYIAAELNQDCANWLDDHPDKLEAFIGLFRE